MPRNATATNRSKPFTSWATPTRSTALKETKHGLCFLEFLPWEISMLRAQRPAAWAKVKGEGQFKGRRYPSVELRDLKAQLDAEDASAVEPDAKKRVGPWWIWSQPFHTRRRKNFRAFLEAFSPGVVDHAFSSGAANPWPMLSLLQRLPRAVELCEGGHRNLVEAYTFAGYLFHEQSTAHLTSLAFARRWLSKSPLDAAERLGLPRRKATLKVLSKIPAGHFQIGTFVALATALEDKEALKRLCHSPVVTFGLVEALRSPARSKMAPAFLESVAKEADFMQSATTASLLDDLVRLAREQGQVLPMLYDVSEVQPLHDELVALARVGQRERMAVRKYTAAPFAVPEGPWETTALLSNVAMHDEGVVMHHCLGTLSEHTRLALNGEFFAWHVEADEPHTVAIFWNGVQWQVYDVKKACNRAPDIEVMAWARQVASVANSQASKSVQLELAAFFSA